MSSLATPRDTMTDTHEATADRAAVAAEPSKACAPRGPRWLTPRLSRWIAAVLAGVALLAVVAIAVQLVLVRPDYLAARADAENRREAVQAAERFTVAVNNFDASDVDTLKQNLTPLLTTKFNTDFEKTVDGLLAEVAKADLTSEGEVIRSAVADIDTDSAEVLVVADATADSAFGPRARHFRWTVDLVKVEGDWLVDNFTPVE